MDCSPVLAGYESGYGSQEESLHLRRSSLFLLSLVLCVGPTLTAQTAPSETSQNPVFRTNARAVVVDVVVSKGNDEPVPALHKQDFQVFEDGKPQTVDYFEEHTAKTLTPGALPPVPKMPPNVYTNVPPAPPADAVNVLLLDSLNTERQDQVFMHKQIVAFLKGMQPGTRAAIFTLGSKLRFIQGFTSDSTALLAALDDKRTEPGKDPAYQSMSDKADDAADLAKLTMMLGPGHSDGGIDAFRAAQADHAEFQGSERTMMTLEALNYLARYLADVPGRKNLIWFASSFPVTIFPTPSQRQAMSQERIYASAVRRTADLLTVSKVAVYPISAQGMMVEHGMESDSAGPGRMGDIRSYSGEASDRASTIFAMEELAADTGGKAYYNTNDLSNALQHAINDGSHYYTLAYTPTNKKMDGKYRGIQVKLTTGKYKLAYRRGYNADDTASKAPPPESDPLRPLLMRGLPSATQLLYGVRVVPMIPQPAPNATHAGKNPKLTCPCTRYSVDFMIRWTDVTLEKQGDNIRQGKISVGLMAYDRDGNAVNWSGAIQGMNLQPDVYTAVQKSGIPSHMEIDLPNTGVYLETGVYDWGTGKAGTVEIPLNPAGAGATAAAQTTPKTN
jgi:VWFA-related protein